MIKYKDIVYSKNAPKEHNVLWIKAGKYNPQDQPDPETQDQGKYPGSRMYNEYDKRGWLVTKNWNMYDGNKKSVIETDTLKKEDLECVTEVKPTEEDLEQLLFGFQVCKHVKSNAITLVKNDMTIGVGAGQMNRVGSAKIALEQAGALAQGAYLASDAFFPMSDTVELAAKYGIKAIIQPGGSIKDQDSIDACNKHGIAMVFTKVRHFKH